MTKQSFFDKLTGTLKVNDSETQSPSVQPSFAHLPPKEALGEKIKITPSESLATKIPSGGQEKTEISHGDLEGQLTVDVFQTPGEIVIKSTIAGVTTDDLDITITNEIVTIKGKRNKDEEVAAEDYFHQECYWGPFSRSIILPVDIDSAMAVASFKNGILTIRLPKIGETKATKVKIVE